MMPNLYLNDLDHNQSTQNNRIMEESRNYTLKNGLLMINKQQSTINNDYNNTTISNNKLTPINKTMKTASSDQDSGLDNTNASGSHLPKTKVKKVKPVAFPPSMVINENDKSGKSAATTIHEPKTQSSTKSNTTTSKRFISAHNSRSLNPSSSHQQHQFSNASSSVVKADRVCSASPGAARQIAKDLMDFIGKSSTPMLLNKSTKKYNSVASLVQNNSISSKTSPTQTNQNMLGTISRSCNIAAQFIRNNQPSLNQDNPYGVSYGHVVEREVMKTTTKVDSSIVFNGQNASNAFGVSTGSFHEDKGKQSENNSGVFSAAAGNTTSIISVPRQFSNKSPIYSSQNSIAAVSNPVTYNGSGLSSGQNSNAKLIRKLSQHYGSTNDILIHQHYQQQQLQQSRKSSFGSINSSILAKALENGYVDSRINKRSVSNDVPYRSHHTVQTCSIETQCSKKISHHNLVNQQQQHKSIFSTLSNLSQMTKRNSTSLNNLPINHNHHSRNNSLSQKSPETIIKNTYSSSIDLSSTQKQQSTVQTKCCRSLKKKSSKLTSVTTPTNNNNFDKKENLNTTLTDNDNSSEEGNDSLDDATNVTTIKSANPKPSKYSCSIEEKIINSSNPLELTNLNRMVDTNGEVGLWISKPENLDHEYANINYDNIPLNLDTKPIIVHKKPKEKLEYVQEVSYRLLKPPLPPPPGDIIIQMKPNKQAPPAPPLIIRQIPKRPETPPALVIRETPPEPPKKICSKIITIEGKVKPPPPRKIVIERLPKVPQKPQKIIVERWLPYEKQKLKRRVIYERTGEDDPCISPQNNLLVEWETPDVELHHKFSYMGVFETDPNEYKKIYSKELTDPDSLPQFVHDLDYPSEIKSSFDQKKNDKSNSDDDELPELVGDVSYLRLIDLDKEGLSEYRNYLIKLGVIENSKNHTNNKKPNSVCSSSSNDSGSDKNSDTDDQSNAKKSNNKEVSVETITEEIFKKFDASNNGLISVADVRKLLVKLNNRFKRKYCEEDLIKFLNRLDSNKDGSFNLSEFRTAFLKLSP